VSGELLPVEVELHLEFACVFRHLRDVNAALHHRFYLFVSSDDLRIEESAFIDKANVAEVRKLLHLQDELRDTLFLDLAFKLKSCQIFEPVHFIQQMVHQVKSNHPVIVVRQQNELPNVIRHRPPSERGMLDA